MEFLQYNYISLYLKISMYHSVYCLQMLSGHTNSLSISWCLSEWMLLALYYPLSQHLHWLCSSWSPCWIPEGTQKASSFNFLTQEVPTNDSQVKSPLIYVTPITTSSIGPWFLCMVIAQATSKVSGSCSQETWSWFFRFIFPHSWQLLSALYR